MLKHTVNQVMSLQDMTSRPHFRVGGGLFVARRAKISIEKDTPVLPIARRAFMPALFMHPLRGIWNKGYAVFLLILLPSRANGLSGRPLQG
jgi:hypothetical protein